MAETVWDLSWAPCLLVAVTILVGGLARGFGGFGASMIWVTGLSLVLPPSTAVPTALLLEVLASLQLLPQVWRDIDWGSLRWLLLGYVVGLPLGTWALVSLPDRPMRVLISLVILGGVAALASGWSRDDLPGPTVTSGTGVASGVLNGAFALGGPPAIILYFSAPTRMVAGRASIIAFFLCTDVLGTASSSVAGLVTLDLLTQVLVLFPVSLVGTAIGAWWFRRSDQADFRRVVLWLLAGLGTIALVNAFV